MGILDGIKKVLNVGAQEQPVHTTGHPTSSPRAPSLDDSIDIQELRDILETQYSHNALMEVVRSVSKRAHYLTSKNGHGPVNCPQEATVGYILTQLHTDMINDRAYQEGDSHILNRIDRMARNRDKDGCVITPGEANKELDLLFHDKMDIIAFAQAVYPEAKVQSNAVDPQMSLVEYLECQGRSLQVLVERATEFAAKHETDMGFDHDIVLIERMNTCKRVLPTKFAEEAMQYLESKGALNGMMESHHFQDIASQALAEPTAQQSAPYVEEIRNHIKNTMGQVTDGLVSFGNNTMEQRSLEALTQSVLERFGHEAALYTAPGMPTRPGAVVGR